MPHVSVPRLIRRVLVVGGLALGLVGLMFSPARASAFDDYAARPELSDEHADVLRLYWAFFDREPDVGGAEYWVGQYDQCASLLNITWSFGVSTEFAQTYGSITDAQFLDLIYGNVLDRLPDPGGRTYWSNQLTTGVLLRAEVMLYFSLSDEFRQHRPLPSDGRPYGGCTPPPTCHEAYSSPCLPIGSDLDCGEIGQRVTLRNPAIDPYKLDSDGDGIGCESFG